MLINVTHPIYTSTEGVKTQTHLVALTERFTGKERLTFFITNNELGELIKELQDVHFEEAKKGNLD